MADIFDEVMHKIATMAEEERKGQTPSPSTSSNSPEDNESIVDDNRPDDNHQDVPDNTNDISSASRLDDYYYNDKQRMLNAQNGQSNTAFGDRNSSIRMEDFNEGVAKYATKETANLGISQTDVVGSVNMVNNYMQGAMLDEAELHLSKETAVNKAFKYNRYDVIFGDYVSRVNDPHLKGNERVELQTELRENGWLDLEINQSTFISEIGALSVTDGFVKHFDGNDGSVVYDKALSSSQIKEVLQKADYEELIKAAETGYLETNLVDIYEEAGAVKNVAGISDAAENAVADAEKSVDKMQKQAGKVTKIQLDDNQRTTIRRYIDTHDYETVNKVTRNNANAVKKVFQAETGIDITDLDVKQIEDAWKTGIMRCLDGTEVTLSNKARVLLMESQRLEKVTDLFDKHEKLLEHRMGTAHSTLDTLTGHQCEFLDGVSKAKNIVRAVNYAIPVLTKTAQVLVAAPGFVVTAPVKFAAHVTFVDKTKFYKNLSKNVNNWYSKTKIGSLQNRLKTKATAQFDAAKNRTASKLMNRASARMKANAQSISNAFMKTKFYDKHLAKGAKKRIARRVTRRERKAARRAVLSKIFTPIKAFMAGIIPAIISALASAFLFLYQFLLVFVLLLLIIMLPIALIETRNVTDESNRVMEELIEYDIKKRADITKDIRNIKYTTYGKSNIMQSTDDGGSAISGCLTSFDGYDSDYKYAYDPDSKEDGDISCEYSYKNCTVNFSEYAFYRSSNSEKYEEAKEVLGNPQPADVRKLVTCMACVAFEDDPPSYIRFKDYCLEMMEAAYAYNKTDKVRKTALNGYYDIRGHLTTVSCPRMFEDVGGAFVTNIAWVTPTIKTRKYTELVNTIPVYEVDENGEIVVDEEGHPVQALDIFGNPKYEYEYEDHIEYTLKKLDVEVGNIYYQMDICDDIEYMFEYDDSNGLSDKYVDGDFRWLQTEHDASGNEIKTFTDNGELCWLKYSTLTLDEWRQDLDINVGGTPATIDSERIAEILTYIAQKNNIQVDSKRYKMVKYALENTGKAYCNPGAGHTLLYEPHNAVDTSSFISYAIKDAGWMSGNMGRLGMTWVNSLGSTGYKTSGGYTSRSFTLSQLIYPSLFNSTNNGGVQMKLVHSRADLKPGDLIFAATYHDNTDVGGWDGGIYLGYLEDGKEYWVTLVNGAEGNCLKVSSMHEVTALEKAESGIKFEEFVCPEKKDDDSHVKYLHFVD